MERPALELTTERLFVQVPAASAARRVLEYCVRNRDHLGPWEPPRPSEYYTTPFWRRQLSGSRDEFESGVSVRTVLIERDPDAHDGGRSGPVIGVVNISQIVRGAFQAAVIGYSLDARAQGRGLMTEALISLVDYAFTELDLNRLMANYRPENQRSAEVLKRLGFTEEGFAKEYLFIDGAWRDHVLTSIVRSTYVKRVDEGARLELEPADHADDPGGEEQGAKEQQPRGPSRGTEERVK